MGSLSATAATYAALIALSATIGYWVGLSSSGLPAPLRERSTRQPLGQNELDSRTSDSEDPDEHEEKLSEVKTSLLEECKLALVVRTDLGMSSGKMAAQCSHATLACYKALEKSNPALLQQWERTGQTKVALRAEDEEELDTLEALARSLNLCARSIHDAGRTQIAAGSRTIVGIGPGPARLVNQVTGRLRLL